MIDSITIHTDGGSRGNPGIAGAGAVVVDSRGQVVQRAFKYLGVMSNNEAEYAGIILGLETAKKWLGKDRVKDTDVFLKIDSELVARQLNGEYQIKEEKLIPWFIKVWNMRVKDFRKLKVIHIPREENQEADQLANQAMDTGGGQNSLL